MEEQHRFVPQKGKEKICPQVIPTPRYTSPHSSLPPKELEQQLQSIHQANDLLNMISNSQKPVNKRQLQLRLRKLRGRNVKVATDCGMQKEYVKATLKDAGLDFMELKQANKQIFIPFQRICALQHTGEIDEGHHPSLTHIDDKLRRALVLRFGEVVSQSPDLINIFFGIPLHLRMQSFRGAWLQIRTEEDRHGMVGCLEKADKSSLVLSIEKEKTSVPIDRIYMIIHEVSRG